MSIATSDEDDAQLKLFFSEIKLEKHTEAMVRAGYDDVSDFENFSEYSVRRLREALAKQDVPDGHIDKIA
eukprot:5969631-Prymnesium_polylepis.1